jgi:hypothetical protein
MPTRHTVRNLIWTGSAFIAVVAIAFFYLLTVPAPLERYLQGRMLIALRQHYNADVQIQNLHVTLVPEFYATADNFVLPNRGGPDLPPLITVKHVTVKAPVFDLLRTPVHLSWVKLDDLVIQVAPKRDRPPGTTPQLPKHRIHLANFVIDKVDADAADLLILRKDPSREPMEFELRKLMLRAAGIGQPMKFTAELTNPTPPGLIETSGDFGPWNFDEPSATKVDGHYNFQHADLSVFNGISGILSSVGDYQGSLHNIIVDGTTDVPDFQLDRGGEPVHLTTEFHAIVDGTNGNTYLQPVNAHFLNSDVVTNGEIAGKPGQKGKSILLDVDIQKARVQDLLALAAKSDPVLTGGLMLKAKLDLPPGNDPVLQKMLLNGRFHVSSARFTTDKVKGTIAALSRRGQGKPEDTTITDVPADFAGDFRLGKGNLTFSKLQFVVPGAVAQVKGEYGLHTEQIDFVGDVRLDATVSQTMTGSKHVLLVPFDPLFKKHGAGTYLPVAIGGTREHPEVKLEWKKLF